MTPPDRALNHLIAVACGTITALMIMGLWPSISSAIAAGVWVLILLTFYIRYHYVQAIWQAEVLNEVMRARREERKNK